MGGGGGDFLIQSCLNFFGGNAFNYGGSMQIMPPPAPPVAAVHRGTPRGEGGGGVHYTQVLCNHVQRKVFMFGWKIVLRTIVTLKKHRSSREIGWGVWGVPGGWTYPHCLP